MLRVGGHGANVELETLNRQVSSFRYSEVEGSQGKQTGGQSSQPEVLQPEAPRFAWQHLSNPGGRMGEWSQLQRQGRWEGASAEEAIGGASQPRR